jgi:hypothetical protein
VNQVPFVRFFTVTLNSAADAWQTENDVKNITPRNVPINLLLMGASFSVKIVCPFRIAGEYGVLIYPHSIWTKHKQLV